MKRIIACVWMVAVLSASYGQALKLKKGYGGILSVGARSSIGLVNDGNWQQPAFGAGAQFRLRFSERVNSDWFFDYLTADLKDYAWRTDYHIGWSVIYYLTKNPSPRFQPYVLAGHCFENLKFTDNHDPSHRANRWSASVQAGAGVHYNITPRFDLSLVAQYMLHMGTKLTAEAPEGEAVFTKHSGFGFQDHVLLHLSINYKIADLW